MKINDLLRYNGSIVRVLDLREGQALVIDCVKRHMPEWVDVAPLEECERTEISELYNAAGTSLRPYNSFSATERKICRERYSIIAPVLPFIGDERRRTEMIYEAADRFNVSKQTIRKYLCLYLAYQDEAVFVPPENKEKPLTTDEKNMRWALNKFYYYIDTCGDKVEDNEPADYESDNNDDAPSSIVIDPSPSDDVDDVLPFLSLIQGVRRPRLSHPDLDNDDFLENDSDNYDDDEYDPNDYSEDDD